jgi:hypothetical protein
VIASVDVSGLVELAWVAPLAVPSVSITYSLCVLGATRASDMRRAGNGAAATAYGALGVVAGLAFAAAVIAGVAVIVNG